MALIFLAALLLLFANDASCQQCQTHIQQYKDGLRTGQIWALKMFDSSAKLPDGILTGAISVPGNFDECLSVRAPEFQGQYCKIYVNVTNAGAVIGNLLPTYEIAACGPSTCTGEEIAQVAQFNLATLGIEVSAQVKPDTCDYEGNRKLDTAAWITISIFIFMAVVVVACGITDWIWEKQKKNPSHAAASVIYAFSVRKNVRELFKIPRKAVPGQVTCLHGIRTLSIAWVFLGHRYEIFYYAKPFINSFDAAEMVQSYSTVPIINALFAVDTFFLLSGFLVTYMFCRENAKGAKFSPLQYYIYRYIRLTVPVAFVLIFTTFVLGYLGSGPLWISTMMNLTNRCKSDWWSTLIYINNFYNLPILETCIPVSWYLSVDMQLSWVAPLILIPLVKWPKKTLIGISLLLLLSTGLNLGVIYAHKLFWTWPILDIPLPGNQLEYFGYVYVMPWMRAQPYLVGMVLGWYMSKPRKPMPKVWAAAVWVLSTACCLAVMFTIIIAYQFDHPYNVNEAAVYNALHRLVWGLSIAWVIYACSIGLGGPVDWILSWKYFVPFSRLTYCIYLSHIFIIFVEIGVLRTSLYLSHLVMIHGLLADYVICVPLAMILYVLTEAPTMQLLKTLFKKKYTRDRNSKKVEQAAKNESTKNDY